MKALIATLLLSLLSSGPAGAVPRFACNLGALTKSERASHHDLSTALLGGIKERKELLNGYAFRFSAAALVPAAQWVGYERKCCPFFSFRIDVAGTEDVWLSLTGPEGVKPFIVAELGLEQ